MHVFMSSTINLVFGMFVLSINAKKYKNIYIYIADASADASLPRFLENDASALRASASLPLRATLGNSGQCITRYDRIQLFFL